jgi:Ca-activated chloride channel homolog
MSFLWPQMLALLLLVPVLIVVYILILQRKKKSALRYASLTMVKDAMGPGQTVRRHIPPLLFLLALTAMLIAVARPMAVVTLPSDQKTVILAMDVSGSMRAEDVEPNRLVASQVAARDFIAAQPASARIGVVSFAGTAFLIQPPTISRDDVLAAIDRLQLQRATAIGSGILISLQAIFPDLEFNLDSANPRSEAYPPLPGRQSEPTPPPVEPGSHPSAAIILLTDGQTTTGPDPIEAARMAAERGVRVYTVGVGTEHGEIVRGDGWAMHVRLDEETLKTVADVTKAEYFHAGSASDLKRVYQTLNSRIVLEKQATEVTALFAAVAALFAVFSALLSLLWFNRVL